MLSNPIKPDELGEFYQVLKWKSYKKLMRDIRDQDVADDIFQHSFAEFLHYYRKGNVKPGLEWGYFFTILNRTSRKAKFEMSRYVRHSCEDVLYFDRKDFSGEIAAIIDVVLSSNILPEKQRKAFGFHRVMGLDGSVAGRRMGMHRSNVYRHCYKADQVFRKIFHAFNFAPPGYSPEKVNEKIGRKIRNAAASRRVSCTAS